MNKKVTSILSYFSIVLWLVAYFAGDREGAKFYLNQSLVISIADTLVGILLAIFSSGVIAVILEILSIVIAVFWIIGLVHAIKQDDKPIPVIGGIELIK